MLQFRSRKQVPANAPIKTTLRECPLNAVKRSRRHDECPQKNQQLKETMGKRCLGIQYLIDLPLGLHCLPRPSSVDCEPKLLCAGLGVLDDGATYLRVDAKAFKLPRNACCKHRDRFLLTAQLLVILTGDL